MDNLSKYIADISEIVQPTRYNIAQKLIEGEPLTAKDLAEEFNEERTVMAYHMSRLHIADFIKGEYKVVASSIDGKSHTAAKFYEPTTKLRKMYEIASNLKENIPLEELFTLTEENNYQILKALYEGPLYRGDIRGITELDENRLESHLSNLMKKGFISENIGNMILNEESKEIKFYSLENGAKDKLSQIEGAFKQDLGKLREIYRNISTDKSRKSIAESTYNLGVFKHLMKITDSIKKDDNKAVITAAKELTDLQKRYYNGELEGEFDKLKDLLEKAVEESKED